jgi:hypothetical protein
MFRGVGVVCVGLAGVGAGQGAKLLKNSVVE